MLRARGCKAERGAGSSRADRPCSRASPLGALRPPAPPGARPRRPCAPRCRARSRRRLCSLGTAPPLPAQPMPPPPPPLPPHHVTRAPAAPPRAPPPPAAPAPHPLPAGPHAGRAPGPGCGRPRRRAGALCLQARDARPGKVPASRPGVPPAPSPGPYPPDQGEVGRGRRWQRRAAVRVPESRGGWDVAPSQRGSAPERAPLGPRVSEVPGPTPE